MSEAKSRQKNAGVYQDGSDIDIADANIDSTLANVWSDTSTGEICVSVDRILFDSFINIAARFLEPHGFLMNLENLLSVVDSMRVGVFAKTSSKPLPDGRIKAKALMPAVFMHLPQKKIVGPLLQRFYDEIAKYESELARLQEFESSARKSVQAAVKDDTGKKVIEQLTLENASLKSEILKLGSLLAQADAILKRAGSNEEIQSIPIGARNFVVRSVRVADGVVIAKHGEQQFSIPLTMLHGMPELNARGIAYFESGVLKSSWVFDPGVTPFDRSLGKILAIDSQRVKIQTSSRAEKILPAQKSYSSFTPGDSVLVRSYNDEVIDIQEFKNQSSDHIPDFVYEVQTKRQLVAKNR